MPVDVPNVAEKETKTRLDWSWVNRASSIVFSFVAGLNVERGIVDLRTGKSDYEWAYEVLIGIAFLLMAITSVMQRKTNRTGTPTLPPQASSKLL
jgi:hypothetical protein